MAGGIKAMIGSLLMTTWSAEGTGLAYAQSDATLADPTRPAVTVSEPASGSVSTGAGTPASPSGLQTVIIGRGRKPTAVINGIMVELGDKIGEATLVKLSETEAVLQGPAGREVLQLLPGVVKKTDSSRPKRDEGKNYDK